MIGAFTRECWYCHKFKGGLGGRVIGPMKRFRCAECNEKHEAKMKAQAALPK